MQGIPIDAVFWPSLAVFIGGLLALVPVWWRGRVRRANRIDVPTKNDVSDLRFACILLLAGLVGLLTAGLTKASQSMDQVSFILIGGGAVGLLVLGGFVADARARHR